MSAAQAFHACRKARKPRSISACRDIIQIKGYVRRSKMSVRVIDMRNCQRKPLLRSGAACNGIQKNGNKQDMWKILFHKFFLLLAVYAKRRALSSCKAGKR